MSSSFHAVGAPPFDDEHGKEDKDDANADADTDSYTPDRPCGETAAAVRG